ncbi:Crooked neck-like protein 1 [Trifolium repens]|nr:Crooked neck-like protein 1 [Trifolium repens]
MLIRHPFHPSTIFNYAAHSCLSLRFSFFHLLTKSLFSPLNQVPSVNKHFVRWMEWMPDQRAWLSYINFELNLNEIRRAREIFERFVSCHTTVAAWIRYAEFELKNGQVTKTRNIYQRAVDKLADDKEAEQLFVLFAEFEARCNETERARSIYKFVFDRIEEDFCGLCLLESC